TERTAGTGCAYGVFGGCDSRADGSRNGRRVSAREGVGRAAGATAIATWRGAGGIEPADYESGLHPGREFHSEGYCIGKYEFVLAGKHRVGGNYGFVESTGLGAAKTRAGGSDEDNRAIEEFDEGRRGPDHRRSRRQVPEIAANAGTAARDRFAGGSDAREIARGAEPIRAEDGADAGRAATESRGAERLGSTSAGAGGVRGGQSGIRKIPGRRLKMNGWSRIRLQFGRRESLLIAFASAAVLTALSGCADEKVAEKPKTPVRVTPVTLAGGAGGIRYSANVTAN